MAKSLAQLQKQIARLEKEAQILKKKESAGVIGRIKEAIAHYDLTAADLGLAPGTRKTPAKARKAGKPKAAPKIKYCDDSGHTWSGHGRRPQWFLDAIASGKTSEELLA